MVYATPGGETAIAEEGPADILSGVVYVADGGAPEGDVLLCEIAWINEPSPGEVTQLMEAVADAWPAWVEKYDRPLYRAAAGPVAALAQKRAQVRRQQAATGPPRDDLVQATATGRAAQPPEGLRVVVLTCVAAVRRLPDDPGQWEAAEALLADLDLTGPKSSQNRP